jgi:hypothetical protein
VNWFCQDENCPSQERDDLLVEVERLREEIVILRATSMGPIQHHIDNLRARIRELEATPDQPSATTAELITTAKGGAYQQSSLRTAPVKSQSVAGPTGTAVIAVQQSEGA